MLSWIIGLVGSSELVRKVVYIGLVLVAVISFLAYQKHLSEKLIRQAEELKEMELVRELRQNEVDILLNPPSDDTLDKRLRDGSF